MDLCSDGPEEICYNSRYCPFCAVIIDKDADFKSLDKSYDALREECDNLKSELTETRAELSTHL